MNFKVKIVEYKLTDLKKDVQQALLFLANSDEPCKAIVYGSSFAIFDELVLADWVCVDKGNYELTPEGLALIREHNRRKLKRRWFR